MKGNKYEIGDLVSCYYRTIPSTPRWDPFIEGRPGIVLKVKKGEHSKYYYTIVFVSHGGKYITKTIAEENLMLYEDIPELDKEIEQLVMDYYKKHPLATD